MELIRRSLLILNRPLPAAWRSAALISVLLLGVALRLVAHYQEPTVSPDGTVLISLAERWIETGRYPFHAYLPFYPFLMKLLMRCGMGGYAAGICVNLTLGSMMPLICYGIMRQIAVRPGVALTAALLAAVNPSAIELSVNIQRDMPYLIFSGAAVFFGLCGMNRRKWYWWVFCGLFLAPGILSRYEAAELLPVFLLYFPVAALLGEISWRRAAVCLLALSLSAAVFLSGLIVILDIGEQTCKAYEQRAKRVFYRKC